MSLMVLPIETIIQILCLLDECEPEQPYWAEKHFKLASTSRGGFVLVTKLENSESRGQMDD